MVNWNGKESKNVLRGKKETECVAFKKFSHCRSIWKSELVVCIYIIYTYFKTRDEDSLESFKLYLFSTHFVQISCLFNFIFRDFLRYVDIFQGQLSGPTERVGKYCGSFVPRGVLSSVSNIVFLRFMSDSSNNGSGFALNYRSGEYNSRTLEFRSFDFRVDLEN